MGEEVGWAWKAGAKWGSRWWYGLWVGRPRMVGVGVGVRMGMEKVVEDARVWHGATGVGGWGEGR